MTRLISLGTLTLALFVASGLLPQLPAHAAGFDCAKAQTKVERLICESPELSKLDDEVEALYKAALENKASAQVAQKAQKEWLKERDACADDLCLLRSYQGRRAKLDGYGYETEAQRLATVRTLIAAEAAPRPASTNDQYRQSGTAAPSCKGMLQDLLEGKYQAIEPVQIREKHDPSVREQTLNSAQVQALQGFSQITSEKLRFCAGAEAEKNFSGMEERFFLGFEMFANTPPFRVYRLPDAVNPYRDADFVYWASPKGGQKMGWQYEWVNLNTCKTVFGVHAGYSTEQEDRYPGGNAQAIALYRGKFSYLEVHKGLGFSIQHLEPGTIRVDSVDKLGTYCAWATFAETTNSK